MTNANNHHKQFAYNNIGQRVRETDALGNSIQFVWDAEDHLIGVVDENGHATGYGRDGEGNLVERHRSIGECGAYRARQRRPPFHLPERPRGDCPLLPHAGGNGPRKTVCKQADGGLPVRPPRPAGRRGR